MKRLATVAVVVTAVIALASGAARTPVAAAPSPVGAVLLPSTDGDAQPLTLSEGDVPALFDDTLLRDVSITVGSDNWLTLLGCQGGAGRPGDTTTRTDVRGVLEVDGTRLENVGVRCKGNSSLSINGSKKPFNITTDSFVDGQKLWGFDVINLNNGWNDPSLLREAIALRMFREYLPVSRFSFARVTMQGRYLGLYTMVEQISGEFADHWYPDDNGTIIKGDSPIRIEFNSSTLAWLGESLATYKSKYEAKGSAAGSDTAYEALREFIRTLDAPTSAGGLNAADFPEGIRQALDVETALWYLATSNVIANFDSYYVGKNYYLYLGQRDPRFHLIPWDLGLSFGQFGLQGSQGGRTPGGGGTNPARVDPFAQDTDTGRPLIRRLLAVPAYRADYLAHYRALYEEVFTPAWVQTVGTSYQNLIRDAVREEATTQGNVAGSYTYDQFVTNLTAAVTAAGRPGPGGPGGGGAPGILALVNERRTYLATLAGLRSPDVRLVEQTHAPTEVTIADAVAVGATFAGGESITDVQLRYRVDGGFENILSATRDAAAVWRATIPPQRQGAVVSYVFRVGLSGDRAAFFPTATLTKPFTYKVNGITLPRVATGALVLNEVMADNSTTLADEAGEYDDWVEIYNRGSVPVDLGGYYLSDRADDPYAYTLPSTTLAPGAYVLVWCDNDPQQGDRHAAFRLGADGETVYLSSRDETVDDVTYPSLGADQVYLRLPDGADTWSVCDRGTPNRANTCDPDAVTTPTAPPPTATATPASTARATATATSTVPLVPSLTPSPGLAAHTLWVPFAER